MSIGGELSKILDPNKYKLVLLSNNLSVIEYIPSSKLNWCLIDWGPVRYRLTTYIDGQADRQDYQKTDVENLLEDLKNWMKRINE